MPSFNSQISSEVEIDYRDEVVRLKSFSEWKSSLVSLGDLAFNGFYSSNDSDYANCMSCGIELGCWEISDVVEEEHRKFSPECAIVKGDIKVINFPIDASAWKKARISNRQLYLRRALVSSKRATLLHPDYWHCDTPERRMISFCDWPATNKLQEYRHTPEEMCQAGFVYTGHSRIIKCVSCLGEILDLSECDDLNELHAKLYPECKLLITRLGLDFINKVLNEHDEPPIKYIRNNISSTVAPEKSI